MSLPVDCPNAGRPLVPKNNWGEEYWVWQGKKWVSCIPVSKLKSQNVGLCFCVSKFGLNCTCAHQIQAIYRCLCKLYTCTRHTEDDLWRKITFEGRLPLTEDDLWQKMTLDIRWPLTEGNLWRKTTFDGRRHSTDDDLRQKMTFDGRHPLAEDNLWR